MFKLLTSLIVGSSAALLCACGSSSGTAAVSSSEAHGTLEVNPPFRIASLNAAIFQAELAGTSTGAQLLQITGNPSCGVDFYYVKFWTVGGARFPTTDKSSPPLDGSRRRCSWNTSSSARIPGGVRTSAPA